MRILYVEDNQANLFLVQRVARMGGHQVISYTTGEAALKNFAQDNPDLVLMDVQLSGELSGLEVVKRLRTSGHKMPIIAVTAYAMVGDRERCMEAGCDSYLSKPLPISDLVELIRKYEARPAASAQPAAQPAASAAPAAPPAPVNTQPAAPPAVTTEPAKLPVVAQPAASTEPVGQAAASDEVITHPAVPEKTPVPQPSTDKNNATTVKS